MSGTALKAQGNTHCGGDTLWISGFLSCFNGKLAPDLPLSLHGQTSKGFFFSLTQLVIWVHTLLEDLHAKELQCAEIRCKTPFFSKHPRNMLGKVLQMKPQKELPRMKSCWATIMLQAACYHWVTDFHENYKHPVGALLWSRLCLTNTSLWWGAGRNFLVGAPGNLLDVIYQLMHRQLHLIHRKEQIDLLLCCGSVRFVSAPQAVPTPPTWSTLQYVPVGHCRCYTATY